MKPSERSPEKARMVYARTGETILVSEEDYEAVSKFTWGIDHRAHTSYARAFARVNGKYKTVRMHRMLLDAADGTLVDHINGNGLDNRRSNLRGCSKAENCRNVSARWGSSAYRGVYLKRDKARPRTWAAQITQGEQRKHLGYFETEREAAEAYDRAASDLFGKFANLNFPVRRSCCDAARDSALEEAAVFYAERPFWNGYTAAEAVRSLKSGTQDRGAG